MNTSSIQVVRLAFLSLATVAATNSGFAQAAEPSEKAKAAKQVADKEVCDSGVRPIQRVLATLSMARRVAISASLLGNKLLGQRDVVRLCPSASRQFDLLLTRSLRVV